MPGWNRFFDELDRIYTQAAQLLKDAEAMMDKGSYDCWNTQGSVVGSQVSYTLGNPGAWYPRWVSRFYGPRGQEKTLGPMAFVSIFFSDEAGRGDWTRKEARIDEALVVAGTIEAQPGVEIEWFYWQCKYWFWAKDAEIGGKVSVSEGTTAHRNWQRTRMFAIPLAEIDGTEALQRRVITPLLGLLQEASVASPMAASG